MLPIPRTFRTALHALRRHLMRTFLTCLGIIIGIAAVITMMEIGKGSSTSIQNSILALGANLLQIDPSDTVKAGASSGSGGRMTLTAADADAVLRELGPSIGGPVKWAAPSVDCHLQVVYGNKNWSPRNVLGTTPAYLALRNWDKMDVGGAEGGLFTDDDVRRVACVCMIGQTVAKALFGDALPIGQEVRVNSVRLRVLGVLSKKGASVTGSDLDDFLVVPWTTVKFRLYGARTIQSANASSLVSAGVNTLNNLYPSSTVQLYTQRSNAQLADTPTMTRFADIDDLWVQVANSQDVPAVKKQLTRLLRERHGTRDADPDDFRMRDLTEMSQALASTSALMTNLLLIVALISLVVGGVGIMNIMLVSVTERTREIGLRMAVGARAKDILRQFLVEATLVCLAGGLVGIAIGRGVSIVMNELLKWPTEPSYTAAVAAVVVSATVGIVFGYYPAWKASRLDPIEALRYE